MVQITFMIS